MKTHVTVVPEDQIIIVEGVPLVFPFAAPDTIHALQWHNGKGHIEYTDASNNTALAGEVDYQQTVSYYVALWEAEKQRLDDEKARLDAEANKPPSPEEALAATQKAFTDAIQKRLDDFAQTKNYDGILSAATYATSTNAVFRAEGQYAVEARDATWAAGYAIMGAVLSGQRPIPTLEDVFAELPALAWPEAGAA